MKADHAFKAFHHLQRVFQQIALKGGKLFQIKLVWFFRIKVVQRNGI